MFFVFSREKIKSYLVSVVTVVILLFTSMAVQNSSSNLIETSTEPSDLDKNLTQNEYINNDLGNIVNNEK